MNLDPTHKNSLAQSLKSEGFDAFYTFNAQRLAGVTSAFVEGFPGKTMYAVKANPMSRVIETVWANGVAGFDVASLPEARLVREHAPGAKAWFMNPAKSRRDVDIAFRELGIRDFVVDAMGELHKLFEVLPTDEPGVRLFVRFNSGDSTAVFDLNSKFGASRTEALALLNEVAARTRWSLGLAFHPGSQTGSVEPYLDAMRTALSLIDATSAKVEALDIGGGFPGRYLNVDPQSPALMLGKLREFVAATPALQRLELLCEPGRALSHDCMSLFARVVLRKDQALHCGAGIYNGLLPAQQFLMLPARAWRGDRLLDASKASEYVVFGPTCDAMDRLAFPYTLPQQLQEGDWIEFQHVGAYSESVRCAFNGFGVDHIVAVTEQEVL